MKREKMLMLVGIFLVAIILSTIHQGYREGMSHDEEEKLKGEKDAATLIETDIEHKLRTMQDSNEYHHDRPRSGDDSDDDSNDDSNDDSHYDDIFGPGGEQQDSHHHKHHKPHKHHKHHKHHQHPFGPGGTEHMNTMHDSSDDNMYMLKSESVPPICPACPQTTACPKKKPCAPCPPCARCPDNNFECKKVPNYEGGNSSIFPTNMFGSGSSGASSGEDQEESGPQPYLNSFSQF